MIVWDYEDSPPLDYGMVWGIQTLVHQHNISSIPLYVEKNAERIRSKYLELIYNIGASEVDGKKVVDHLDVDSGFSLWWMSHISEKSPFKSPKIRDCINFIALEEIIVSSKASAIFLFTDNRQLARAMKILCNRMSIEYSWHHKKKLISKPTLRSIYDVLPHTIKGLLSLRHWITNWIGCIAREKIQWFSGENAVFFCSYFINLDSKLGNLGQFYSRHWGELPHLLQKAGMRLNWIQHLLFSPEIPNLNKALKWLKKFNKDSGRQGHHMFLHGYISISVIWRVIKRWLWLCKKAWLLRMIGNSFYPVNSNAWLWPFLKDEWMSSLCGTVAISNLFWIELFDLALKGMPHQNQGFYLYENQGWELALIRAWKKYHHGTLIGIQHATVGFWHLCYFDDARSFNIDNSCAKPLPDYFAVNGLSVKDSFIKSGYPRNKVIELEALRYMKLIDIDKMAGRRRGVLGDLNKNNLKKILVLGDINATETDRLLRSLNEIATDLPFKSIFTFKAHPSCPINIGKYTALLANEVNESLESVLPEFDVVIAANSTSAAVDSYINGLKVLVWLNADNLNLSPLMGFLDVWFVSSSSQIKIALLTDSPIDPRSSSRMNYYYLDKGLPRWRALLGF